ncbi:MAG: hypothetical protein ABIJ45_07730 [Candidatus Zixiibacteriota bacterium]
MKTLVLISILFLSISINAKTDFYHSSSMACSFEYPSEWQLDTSQANSITIGENELTILTIVRHFIGTDDIIRSEDDLYEGILGLYNDLGIRISEDKAIDCRISGGKAEFDYNYTDFQKESNQYIHKYLKGIVLKNINKQQIFYFMIAQSEENNFAAKSPDFDTILGSFQLDDVVADELFVRRSVLPYLQVMLILALAAFFYARNRRVQKSKNPLGLDSGSHWRCDYCRKVNHVEFTKCSRCGKERKTASSTHASL